MIEYHPHLKHYKTYWWSSFSYTIPESEWGNEELARSYLEKYWLSQAEYEKEWQPIQDQIFINQEKGLPAQIFSASYELMALRGGAVLEEIDLEALQKCMLFLGDEYFVIIENTYGGKLDEPPFRMKYPVNISWRELMSGNFISSIIFEMYYNDYFVFSNSGVWGMYVASEYDNPLNIIGFKPKHRYIFNKNITQSEEEWKEIKEHWLPSDYHIRTQRPHA